MAAQQGNGNRFGGIGPNDEEQYNTPESSPLVKSFNDWLNKLNYE